jgi:3-oxoacyl-[acyl-carrier-protein] synthase III
VALLGISARRAHRKAAEPRDQANSRVIEAVAKRLGLDRSKVFIDIDRFADTSAASIPIALSDAVAQGRVRQGDTLVFAAFGGGMTWGAAVVEWSSSVR